MESRTTRRFRDALNALPDDIQKRARETYSLFRENPNHPSLRFKKVHSKEPIYSARVSLDYRAVGLIQGNAIIWFWIGTHADYERLLESLSDTAQQGQRLLVAGKLFPSPSDGFGERFGEPSYTIPADLPPILERRICVLGSAERLVARHHSAPRPSVAADALCADSAPRRVCSRDGAWLSAETLMRFSRARSSI